MRKILIVLVILIVTMSIFWIFTGRQISTFVDQFKTSELN
jgi:dipeptide/tripeptide permease